MVAGGAAEAWSGVRTYVQQATAKSTKVVFKQIKSLRDTGETTVNISVVKLILTQFHESNAEFSG